MAEIIQMAREKAVLSANNLDVLAGLFESPQYSDLLFGGDLEFDEMAMAPAVGGEPFDEARYLEVQRRVERNFAGPKGTALSLPCERVRDAVLLVAQQRRYHPVREFLSGLKWDGVPRIASVLEEILGVEPTELSQAMMRAWFISAVARPMKPGCKVDHVLILVGPQSLGKSQFFVELAGAKWFSDSVIDIQNRDSYLLMRRVWILEWSELEAMQRARHQDAVKAFITSAVDIYRAPYARSTESVPRTSIIVGTTNDASFLSDPSGNRRYWPIGVKREVNLRRLREWGDLLWAEAVVAYNAGEKWWLTPAMEEQLSEQQGEFEQIDPWTEPVLGAAANRSGLDEDLTTAYLLTQGLDKPKGQWSRADEMRVGAIMRKAGWHKRRVRVGTRLVYLWERGETT